MSYSQFARLIYIEPNDVASTGDQFVNNSDGPSDNITWQPEDYTYFADLQVVVPDINDCGLVDYDGRYFNFSVNEGQQLGKDKERLLTTDYVNVGYTELKKNGQSTREFLGMNSINVDFNYYFFPEVTINFTDVRGYSLMMPTEENYRQNLELEANGKPKDFENLYQALFHFPYPKFYLTIKGYYGTRVTFELAVRDFKTSFNPESGSFDVTLQFIGYLYGLYTDIPMNYLLIAPYIDSLAVNEPGGYWSNNSNFTYVEGGKIQTFVEFLDSFVRVSDKISQNSENIQNNEYIKEYSNIKGKIDAYTGLKNSFSSYFASIASSYGERNKIGCANGSTYNAYFINESGLGNGIINIPTSIASELDVSINAIKDKYGVTVKRPTIGLSQVEEIGSCEVKLTALPIDSSSLDMIRKSGLDDLLINEIDSRELLKQYNRVAILNHHGVLSSIKDKINKLEATLYDKAKAASDVALNIFEKELGFKPTIRNIFRMIFAHLDTFMHFVYNGTLKIISDSSRNGSRIKVKDVLKGGVRVDIPRKNQNTPSYSLPPFTGFYEKKDSKWEMFFPARYGQIPEVKLVNDMVSSVLLTRKRVNEVYNYTQKRESQNNNANSGSYKMGFFPTIVSDYFHYGVNPYDYLKYDSSSSEVSIGEMLYMAAYRIFVAKKTRGTTIETSVENDNNGVTVATLKTNEDEGVEYADIEAYNYYLHKKNATVITKEMLNGIDSFDVIKKYIDSYTAYCKNQYLGDIKLNDYDIEFTGKDTYVYFKQCYKKGNSGLKFPSDSKDSIDGILHIFDAYEKKKCESYLDLSAILQEADDLDISKCYTNIEVSGTDKYFKNVYECGGDLAYRLYEYNPNVDFEPKRYKKSDNDGKSYYQLVSKMFDTEDVRGYRYPGLALNDLTNIFTTTSNKKDAPRPYVEKYANRGREAKAFLLLSAIPFKTTYLNSLIDAFAYEELTVESKSFFKIVPKCVLLYLGGWFYRHKIMDGGGKDLLVDCKAEKDQWTKLKDGKFTLEGEDVGCWAMDKLDERIKTELIKYFTDWCKSEQFMSLWEALLKSDYLLKNGYQYFKVPHNTAEVQLMKLYVEPCYVLYEKKNIKSNSVGVKALLRFVKTLNTLYSKDEGKTGKATNEVMDTDVSEETRLSIYRTLKTLNDKWLNSYTYGNFSLDDVATETSSKRRRFESNEYSNELRKEFNSFLFVDSFYTDIGDKMRINPKTVYDMVLNAVDAKENYSLYQFMADLCQKNKLLFITLPVYNNYYDSTTIKDIFSVHPKYDETKRIGNTYICMYAYEPSHVVNDDDIGGEFSNDGLLLNKNNSISLLESAEAIQFTQTSVEDMNITVPAFGVTYARQNQSYFKSIEISMDTPNITDYGILNLLEISKLGGRGFTDEPFAIGQDIFSIYSNRSYSCTVEMMGCMNIMPMMYFQLNNVPMFEGAYMIVKVSHNVVPGNTTTKFTGIRINKNQIPFNNDIFNVNTFIQLVNEFGYTHNAYSEVSETLSPSEVTNVKPSKPITNEDAKANAKIIKGRLKAEFGWTDVQVAGILGNMQQESMFNPKSVNKTEKKAQKPRVKNEPSRDYPYNYGAGLIQWTFYSRKIRVLGYIGKGSNFLENVSIGTAEGGPGGIEGCTLDEQITMLIAELRAIFPKVVSAISKCKSVEESATTFYYRVERSPKNEDKIYKIADMNTSYNRMEAERRTANAKNYVSNEG